MQPDSPEPQGAASRIEEGALLWSPTPESAAASRMARYMDWLGGETGRSFADYGELWRWSVEHLEEFWASIWRYFSLGPSLGGLDVLVRGHGAEGAQWFPKQQLNYAVGDPRPSGR